MALLKYTTTLCNYECHFKLINIIYHLFIKGGLVYANYGRKVDFEYLKTNGIDIRNHVVIARYGAIFRGNIVHL